MSSLLLARMPRSAAPLRHILAAARGVNLPHGRAHAQAFAVRAVRLRAARGAADRARQAASRLFASGGRPFDPLVRAARPARPILRECIDLPPRRARRAHTASRAPTRLGFKCAARRRARLQRAWPRR
jgi:hypothetical protein